MKYTLNKSDFFRGLILAVGMDVLTVIQNSIAAKSLKFDWQNIGFIAVGTVITYLTKNFLTDSIAVSKTVLKEAAADTAEARKVDMIVTKK